MTNEAFVPTVYLKQGCPFCMKVDIFILESGLRDQVNVRRFAAGTDDEASVRGEVEPHLEKVSFPAAELASGRFLADSDGIIAELADKHGIDKAGLATLDNYVEGPFKGLMSLWGENVKLKEELAELKK